MDTFLHIGYPKCFSTTLQREFYSAHPELFYGGIGTKESNIDFYNDELNLLFESGLIYFRSVMFRENEHRFRKALDSFYEDAEHADKRIAGFSSEHMLFNFTPQTVDIPEKLRRLKLLFGPDVKLIWVIREHHSLLMSLYNEYVKMGYSGTYQDYLEWVYKYQDRNFLYDMRYSLVYDEITKVFELDNLLLLCFEDQLDERLQLKGSIATAICEFMGVSDFIPEFSNRNPSFSAQELEALRFLNETYKYDFGSELLYGIEDHRRRVFFNTYLHLGLSEKELFHNVLEKRAARTKLSTDDSLPYSNYRIKRVTFDRLDRVFQEDIELLESRLSFGIKRTFTEQRKLTIEKLHINE